MKALLGALMVLAAGAFIGGNPAPAAADAITISHTTWVGYGPLYIARDKGIFAKNGLASVELILVEDPKERYPALLADRIEVIASTVDTALLYLRTATDLQYVAALDDSKGADGIVANQDIRTIADLRGKRVAVNEGSASEFYLAVLLAKAGLTESDVTTVNMTSSDAGAAFVAKRVDAAVTWEPHLSMGKTAAHGHLLVDTSTTPGLLTDVLIAKTTWITSHQKEAAALVESWYEAVDYYRAHPDESVAIMAKGVGGWLEKPADFKKTLTGINFYGAAENKVFFGTKDKPGPLYETVKYAIDIWSGQGRLRAKVTPEDLINYSFADR